MNRAERPRPAAADRDLTLTRIEWTPPEHDQPITLAFDHPDLATLPTEARDQLTLALARLATLLDDILIHFGADGIGGTDATDCFRFLANHMQSLAGFYDLLVGDLAPETEEPDFPF